jgi:hypothetical protein
MGDGRRVSGVGEKKKAHIQNGINREKRKM